MGTSMATKVVLLLVVVFTISVILAFQTASADEETSKGGVLSRNVSEQSIQEREARVRPRLVREMKLHLQRPRLATGRANVVVAQDGSGNYRTIKEALDVSRRSGAARFVIHVKRGIYRENLFVTADMRNVMLTGDGKGVTVITGHKSFAEGGNTWSAATIVIWGDGFVARDITFQNTAGSGSHQAPALTSKAPHSAFYRCAFEGYQDTVYAQHGLQFYRECDIYGSVDFICGDAAVVIQNSNIYLRRSSTGNELTIAASSRESSNSATGIVFQNCRITAAPDLKPVLNSYEIYLGRPWKSYSRTVYIHSDFDVPVEPRGWLEWAGNANTNTAYYREFGNRGVGSSTGGRVKWPGVKASPVITSEANQFTVGNFIHGNSWLPSTGVPFTPGL